jgi:hypothetical protein
MNRQWHVRRELLPTPDGQQRWDQAYLRLLSWVAPQLPAPATTAGEQHRTEGPDASRNLCAGIDAAAGAGTVD